MATPIGVPAKAHTTITTSAQIRAVGQDEGRKVRFLASTSQKDRHGTIVSPTGIQTDSFLKNPVFLWSHKSGGSCDPEDVIGRVTSLSVSDAGLEIEVEFAAAEMNPKADRCLSLVRAGFLNAVSIGFIPIESRDEDGVIVHDKIDLLEVSLVVVGSNSDALALRQLITRSTHNMTREEACKKLNIDEGASQEECERALMQYLASTDDDPATRKEVMGAIEGDKGEDKDKGEEDRDAAADESKDEDEGTRAAIAALTSELQAARAEIAQVAEQRAVAEKDAEQTKWVDRVISEGRWSPAKRAELLDLARKGIAESTVRHIPQGTFTRPRIFEGGNPVSAASAQVQTAALTDADKRVLKVFEDAGMKIDHTRYLSDKARIESKVN